MVKMFSLYPLWKDLFSGIDSGVNYPLTQLFNEDQKLDLNEALVLRNQKGVDKHRDLYLKLIKKKMLFMNIVFHSLCPRLQLSP